MRLSTIPRQRAVAFTLVIASVLLAGCQTRSISNSGYVPNRYYAGELNEFDIVGADATPVNATDSSSSSDRLALGQRVLVIQSGAEIPDSEFVEALRRYRQVSIFSGVPFHRPQGYQWDGTGLFDYSKALLSAAQRGGFDSILVYWGFIESRDSVHEATVISLVPIIGPLIPDEKNMAHIRLKVLLADVKTGHWSSFSPRTFSDSGWSSPATREGKDQDMVHNLKSLAYEAAVDELMMRYGG